jgi:hypothetical protein
VTIETVIKGTFSTDPPTVAGWYVGKKPHNHDWEFLRVMEEDGRLVVKMAGVSAIFDLSEFQWRARIWPW